MSKVEKINLADGSKVRVEDLITLIKNKHAELFPDTDLNAQVLKLAEEATELLNAKRGNEMKQELADMFIVGCGIMRFNFVLGRVVLLGIITPLIEQDEEEPEEDPTETYLAQLIVEVIRKMNQNIDRVWSKHNGVYKHISHLN